MSTSVDYLIIGQGLAGSLLGWELIRRGQTVMIIDPGTENASRVAAGLINPVTGQRLVKAADTERLLESATKYYAVLELFFRQSFFIEQPMLRLLHSARLLEIARQRLADPTYAPYLERILDRHSGITSPFGLLVQRHTGHVETRALLRALKQFFIDRCSYRQAQVCYRDIHWRRTVNWQGLQARAIIFCEGYHMSQNPWFNWLPLQPVKGEILTGFCVNLPGPDILNYGHWLMPITGCQFKTGATFEHDTLDITPTERAKATLLSELEQVCPALSQATTLCHQAGIRPATQDRQPFIGFHPKQAGFAVFNGFGAKGSLLIPYYCQLFADVLQSRQALPGKINIFRHYDSHFSH